MSEIVLKLVWKYPVVSSKVRFLEKLKLFRQPKSCQIILKILRHQTVCTHSLMTPDDTAEPKTLGK